MAPMKRLVLAFLLLTACATGQNPTVTSSPANNRATISGHKVVVRGTVEVVTPEVSVEVLDSYFKPNILRGDAGAEITIQLRNAGTQLHNFTISEQGISVELTAGSQSAVKVKFPESGAVAFFCKYHIVESDMLGELEAR